MTGATQILTLPISTTGPTKPGLRAKEDVSVSSIIYHRPSLLLYHVVWIYLTYGRSPTEKEPRCISTQTVYLDETTNIIQNGSVWKFTKMRERRIRTRIQTYSDSDDLLHLGHRPILLYQAPSALTCIESFSITHYHVPGRDC